MDREEPIIKTTTPAHLEVFKKEALKYIRILKLDQWEVHFCRRSMPGFYAQLAVNYEGKVCTFALAMEWKVNVVPLCSAQLKASGKHEAIELLMSPLRYLGEQRFLSEDQFDAEAEGIIRKLEKLL